MSTKRYKEKYLIALDLDGTTLKDNKSLCLLTNLYLRKIIKEDFHYLTFSSGRSYKDVKDYAELVGIKLPLILNNGAIIYDPFTQELDYKGINSKLLKQCIMDLSQYIEAFVMESFNRIYYTDDKHFDFMFRNIENTIKIKGDTESLLKLLDENPSNFIAKFKPNYDRDQFREDIVSYNKKFEFRIWYDMPFFEISPRGVSKYTAIMKLAKKLNIDKNHIIFFGDQENDLECLKNFKNAYLMKNGNPNFRQYAPNVTRYDNNHNGIYKELKPFLKSLEILEK